MNAEFTGDYVTAGHVWMNRLPPQVVSRAMPLVNGHAILNCEWEDECLYATVQGGDLYELDIPFERGRFQDSGCDCAYGTELQARGGGDDLGNDWKYVCCEEQGEEAESSKGKEEMSAPKSSLISQMQERLGKKPSREEQTALKVIDGWWQQKKRSVALNQLLQLGGIRDWSYSEIALHGKSMPPQDAWEYLACVEAKLAERGGNLPGPLGDLIDRERQKILMEAQRNEVAVKEWRTRLGHWAQAIPEEDAMVRPALRMRLASHGAVIEWRKQGQAEFVKATASGLKNMPQTGQRGVEDVILAHFRDPWGNVRTDFHSGDEALAKLIMQFVLLPDLRHGIVGASGAPLVVHESMLKWSVTEEAGGGYHLALRDVEGRTPPDPLLIVLSTGLFVASDEAWPVERWPLPSKDAAANMSIPAAATGVGGWGCGIAQARSAAAGTPGIQGGAGEGNGDGAGACAAGAGRAQLVSSRASGGSLWKWRGARAMERLRLGAVRPEEEPRQRRHYRILRPIRTHASGGMDGDF